MPAGATIPVHSAHRHAGLTTAGKLELELHLAAKQRRTLSRLSTLQMELVAHCGFRVVDWGAGRPRAGEVAHHLCTWQALRQKAAQVPALEALQSGCVKLVLRFLYSHLGSTPLPLLKGVWIASGCLCRT